MQTGVAILGEVLGAGSLSVESGQVRAGLVRRERQTCRGTSAVSELCQASRTVTDCRRASRTVTDCHWASLTVTDCHRASRTVTDCHRASQTAAPVSGTSCREAARHPSAGDPNRPDGRTDRCPTSQSAGFMADRPRAATTWIWRRRRSVNRHRQPLTDPKRSQSRSRNGARAARPTAARSQLAG